MVSVIIAAYNVEKYISACIESVFRQTWSDFELIVVDDGSTDATPEICRAALEGHPNARCIRQQNAGAGAARNAGIDAARGEYVMFVDGDDQVEPEIVERLLAQMDEDTDIAACCCTSFSGATGAEHRYRFFPESFAARTDAERENLFLQLIDLRMFQQGPRRTGIGVPWGKLYRASMLRDNALRFPPLRRMQDNIFNMYAFTCARRIVYLDEPLYRYRDDHISGVNLSADARCAALEAREVYFAAHPEQLTPRVRDAFYQERARYLGNSLKAAAEGSPLRTARDRAAALCARPVYARFLREPMERATPPRYRLMIRLARLRLYRALALLAKGGAKH